MSVRKKIEAKYRTLKSAAPMSSLPAARGAAAAPAPAQGVPAEVVAAISGAVAMMLGDGAVVTGVRPAAKRSGAGRGRSEWSTAGLLEATRPF